MKRIIPPQDELLKAAERVLPDVIDYDLHILFCGINPGLYTAYTGHHYARPGNRFWRVLYESGFTDRVLAPEEDREVLRMGYGLTNLVPRATAAARELAREEYIRGGEILRKKLHTFRPRWCVFVGIEAYRNAYMKPDAQVGDQRDTIEGVRIYLVPSPSGLNAHYSRNRLIQIFSQMRKITSGELC